MKRERERERERKRQKKKKKRNEEVRLLPRLTPPEPFHIALCRVCRLLCFLFLVQSPTHIHTYNPY